MTKSSGKCGCTKCARRRKRKKEVKSVITEEMAYQHQNKMAPTVEENKTNLETGQVNNLNEEEYSHLGDYRKLYLAVFVFYILVTCITFLSMKFIFNLGCLFN
ncbi:GSCOCG00003918001-RA-CDS [Cotesia congregata]|nr:GSCOCG00003918001-RA-CDS [Cotesia congregata]